MQGAKRRRENIGKKEGIRRKRAFEERASNNVEKITNKQQHTEIK